LGENDESDAICRYVADRRGSRMRWAFGLEGTGIDGQSLSSSIMDFDRPDCLEDIANLGPTLDEGTRLLARVQQAAVAAQVTYIFT
jgi:hypothetical protein